MTIVANALWVALGGAIGSSARYLVAVGSVRWLGPTWWVVGTLAVNFGGSLLLAALLQVFVRTEGVPPGARLMLTTGLMGGFTTYSTFNYELLDMLQAGRTTAAGAYLVTTVVVCLGGGAAGMALGRWAGT